MISDANNNEHIRSSQEFDNIFVKLTKEYYNFFKYC
jgi:hypothetical protein